MYIITGFNNYIFDTLVTPPFRSKNHSTQFVFKNLIYVLFEKKKVYFLFIMKQVL